MNRRGTMALGVLGCVLAVAGAQADTPYQSIVDRNVFSLKPPTPVTADTTPSDLPNLTLEGIDDILGHKQVIFKCAIQHPAAGQPGEKSYLMDEGETQDGIEVVSIDQDAGTVKFNNNGTEQTLDLKTDAAKPSGGGGPAPNPAVMRMPGMNPNGFPPGRRIPSRLMRGMGPGGANAAPPYGGPSSSPSGVNVTSIGSSPSPSLNQYNSGAGTQGFNNPGVGGGNNGNGFSPTINAGGATSGASTQDSALSAAPQNQVPNMTPEEQTILIELERERTKQDVATGDTAPPPLTDLTPPESMLPGTIIDGVDVTAPQGGQAAQPQ